MKLLYVILLLGLSGCMPDSLTKFKESAPKKTTSTSSSSSSAGAVSGGSGAAAGPTSWYYQQGSTTLATTAAAPLIMYLGTAITAVQPVISGFTGDDFTFTIYSYDATATLSNCTPVTATTSAPTGISFNSTTGTFTGTPTAYALNSYTIQAEHLDSGDTSCVHLFMVPITDISFAYFAQVEDRNLVAYSPLMVSPNSGGDYLALTLDTTPTDFTVGQYIIDSEQEIVGQIKFKDETNKIIYVQITDQKNNVNTDLFEVNDPIDYIAVSTYTYVSQKAKITAVSYIFQADTDDSHLRPIIYKKSDGTFVTSLPEVAATTFSVSPTGIDVTVSSSGVLIDAAPAELDKTLHVFTMARHANSYTQSIYVTITNPPQDLSVGNLLLLPTNLTSTQATTYFPPGRFIASSGTGKGRIIKSYTSTVTSKVTLVVAASEGVFADDQTLDNAATYGTNRATIDGDPSVITDIVEHGTDPAALTYLVAEHGADNYGLLIDYDNANNYSYVRTARGNLKDDNAGVSNQYDYITISAGATTSATSPTFAAADTDITTLWSKFLYIYDSAAFAVSTTGITTAGVNFSTTSSAVTVMNSGKFNATSSNDYVMAEVHSVNPINSGETVVSDAADAIFSAPEFVAYRGEKFVLYSAESYGSGISYTISPTTLPTGLSLSGTTGIISGTPTAPYTRTAYTITASNGISSDTYIFYLEVKDQLFITNITSNAPSFNLHKSGFENYINPCRITQDQISGATAHKNILCYLDGGELDIYNNGLSMTVDVGLGMCEYIRVQPYKFWNYQYKQSSTTTIAVHNFGNCSSCDIGGGAIACTTAAIAAGTVGLTDQLYCSGDYSDTDNPEYASSAPNCDDGSAKFYTWTDTNADGDCDIPSGTNTSCGGKRAACLDGATRDYFSTAQLDAGVDRQLNTSFGGLSKTYTFSSPLSKSHASNLYIANYSAVTPFNGFTAAGTGISSTFSNYNYDHTGLEIFADSLYSSTTTPYDPFMGTNPYYTIECLDYAEDVVARIRIAVRDWDRTFTPQETDDTLVALTGTFDTTGTALTGTGSALTTELNQTSSNISSSYMFLYDSDTPAGANYSHATVVDTSAAVTATTATLSTDFSSPAAANLDDAIGYISPLKMDAGNTVDAFGIYYNNRTDWDDSITYRSVGQLTGTVTTTVSSTTLDGGGTTSFDTELEPGDIIFLTGGAGSRHIITSITDSDTAIIYPAPTSALAGVTFYRMSSPKRAFPTGL